MSLMRIGTRLGMAAAMMVMAVSARADVRALSLYEKSGRAPVVVWGEVSDGDDRFANVTVLEVLKGKLDATPGGAIRVVYRLDSFLRKPWQDRIAFSKGERLILFARRFTKEDGDTTAPDLYTLMWGADGKYLLPPEGEKAHVDAVRALVAILTQADIDRQESMLVESIDSPNPMLAETALEELHRQGLGTPSLIPRLLALSSHEREVRRVLAMRLLGRILGDEATAGREVAGAAEISDRLRGLLALDPSGGLRAEVVLALARLGGDENRAFLQRIAREDPDQQVRYNAERELLSWRSGPTAAKP